MQLKLDKNELNIIEDALGEVILMDRTDYEKALDIIKKVKRVLTPIKISSRKGKGRNLQKWVCQQISEMIGVNYDQSNDQSLIHSREMGQSGVDVILRGQAQLLFPFSIETKNTESLSLYSVIKQVKNNQVDGIDWLIVHKKNNSEPIIIMDWKAFRKWFCKKGFLL